MISRQFDTLLKLTIIDVSVHKDFDFVHLRSVPHSIWYRDAVATFQRLGALPNLRPPKRAQILRRSEIKILKTIAHNEIMSTKRKACCPETGNQPPMKGRPKQAFGIGNAVKLVSDCSETGWESMPCCI